MKIVKSDLSKGDIYNKVIAHAVLDNRLKDGAYRLYTILFNAYTKPKPGKKAFTPSESALGKLMGVSSRQIKRYLNNLKEFGYISVIGNNENATIFVLFGDKYVPLKSSKRDKK